MNTWFADSEKPMPTSSVEERLLSLLRQLKKVLPGADCDEFHDLAIHREWGVALENLCQELFEHDISVGAAELGEIKRLAEDMDLPSETWSLLVVRRKKD